MNMVLPLKRFWLWRGNRLWGWFESAIVTILVLLFCYFVNPTNPLFVKEGFPWPWVAPIVIIFQYGFGPSILSASLIAVAAILLINIGIPVADFQTYIVSGFAIVLICGLFGSTLVKRMISAEISAAYTEERLASLASSYYMLRVSYDYLEQNIITKPSTLRLALYELQKINLSQQDPLSYDVAKSFLLIISQFCSMDALGIYLYKGKKLLKKPFVEVGVMGQLIERDPLIKQCMDLDEIAYVNVAEVEEMSNCNYLVAMPLITHNNERLGLLVVKEMSFWSLTDEVLRVLSILVYYFMRNTVFFPEEAQFLREYPGMSVDFVRQLNKLTYLKGEMNLDSALAAIMISKQFREHNVIYNLKNQHRFLDSSCSLELKDYDVLITLMPFTEATGIHGYITRTLHYLQSDLGLSPDNDKIKTRSLQINKHSPLDQMHYFVDFIEGKNSAN